jgi:hypothetical protein
MALYEIQTLTRRGRTSLISYGDFPNDVAAILGARALKREGEAVDVWQEKRLVYRELGALGGGRRSGIEAPMVMRDWGINADLLDQAIP